MTEEDHPITQPRQVPPAEGGQASSSDTRIGCVGLILIAGLAITGVGWLFNSCTGNTSGPTLGVSQKPPPRNTIEAALQECGYVPGVKDGFSAGAFDMDDYGNDPATFRKLKLADGLSPEYVDNYICGLEVAMRDE